MNAILIRSEPLLTCEPVTAGSPITGCPLANRTLGDWHAARLAAAGLSLADAAPAGALALYMQAHAWLSDACLARLAAARTPRIVRDAAGRPAAWISASPTPPDAAPVEEMDTDSLLIRYPWDILRLNEQLVAACAPAAAIEGTVSPHADIEGPVRIGRGSIVRPGVLIQGPAVIGEDCVLGPNCYIRPGTSIGDRCRIGNAVELKNSLVMPDTCVAHLSYCGDSILGRHVNLGGGTITANARHDGQTHRSAVGGVLLDTGRAKFGAVLGDGVHTGIHTSIYPGRKLWPHTWTRPGAVIQRDLGPGESV